MLALCLMLSGTYYAKNYESIIGCMVPTALHMDKEIQISFQPCLIANYEMAFNPYSTDPHNC